MVIRLGGLGALTDKGGSPGGVWPKLTVAKLNSPTKSGKKRI
jgi:hypothetical protein